MIEAARAKMDAGDLAGAQTLANDLLQQFPNSPKAPGAQLMLGRIRLKTTPDATQDLLTAFSLVRTKYPQSAEAADALVHIGFLHSRSRTAESVADFESFIQSYPNHAETARVSQSLGRLYLKTRELDKAEASFDRVKTIAHVSSVIAGEAALQSGFVKIMKFYADRKPAHLTAAIESLTAMSSSKSLKVRARAELGIAESLLLLNRCSEAREKYLAAARTYADQPYFRGMALYGAAVSSQSAGNAGTAVDDYAALLAALSGATLAEKDAAWKAVALGSTSTAAQAGVRRNGSYKRIPGSEIVCQSAYQRSVYLHGLGRYEEASNSLTALIAYLPATSQLRAQATILLDMCNKAKEGKQ